MFFQSTYAFSNECDGNTVLERVTNQCFPLAWSMTVQLEARSIFHWPPLQQLARIKMQSLMKKCYIDSAIGEDNLN